MKKELKILLLEDVADDAGLVDHALRKERLSFISQRVDTRESFIEALHDFIPDVVLSDHGLPQFNSIEALQLCREQGLTAPFILVTGTVSEEFAVNCLKQGADDYVLKSNLSRLPSAIVNSLNKREAEENKKIAQEELRRQNEELISANKKLVKTNTELDNFVYSVSHNLRAPLSSVLGLINVAKMEEEAKKAHFTPFLSMMEKSIQKLDETLREILDYSRNSRGDIRIEKVDPERFFYESLEKLKYLSNTHQVEARFRSEGPDIVYSDAYRIRMIFNNMIANAIKYSDPSKPRKLVTVTVKVTDKVTMVFEDNGIGMRESLLPHIFDMFYRGTERSEGAGLGLYIVKEAVEKLNGRIDVESREGVGSVFTITLANQNQAVKNG
jgi:signal transduction histidine kinase